MRSSDLGMDLEIDSRLRFGSAESGRRVALSPHAWVGIACAALLGWGSLGVDALGLAAEDGLGYALGIVGLSAMTLLLGYSLRKRARALRNVGPLSRWLEIHLVLGLIGPTAILYHSGFRLGSLNATLAMFCMLAVAGSGVGGRIVYGRLHRGLAGPRRTVDSLRREARRCLAPLEAQIEATPEAGRLLDAFEAFAFGTPSGWPRLLRVATLRMRSWLVRRRVLRLLVAGGAPGLGERPLRSALRRHFSAQCRAVELRIFEQVFALWHAIHIPLCVILFASAVIHVVAVHLY